MAAPNTLALLETVDVAEMDGPALAHTKDPFSVEMRSLCGAPVLGIRVRNPPNTCPECDRIWDELIV